MSNVTEETGPSQMELAVDLVCAYVSKNAVPIAELPALIKSVRLSLSGLGERETVEVSSQPVPAVPIKKSITREYLISLEDGKKYKSLRRHLKTKHDMTPEDYRRKWNLPADYPMVAPAYSEQRSALAKSMGLGQKQKPQRRKRAKSASTARSGK